MAEILCQPAVWSFILSFVVFFVLVPSIVIYRVVRNLDSVITWGYYREIMALLGILGLVVLAMSVACLMVYDGMQIGYSVDAIGGYVIGWILAFLIQEFFMRLLSSAPYIKTD